MGTRELSGVYNAGYALKSGYSDVVATSTAVINGATGVNYGDTGGIGLTLAFAVTATNGGQINGGRGAAGARAGGKFEGGGGGAGGVGVDLAAGGTVTNTATVIGGMGGVGGEAFGGGPGGTGGAGMFLAAGGTVVNTATVLGGVGGFGGAGTYDGPGGDGGAGLVLAGGGTVVNSGYVAGGYGGTNAYQYTFGATGDGVIMLAGGVIQNTGTIGRYAPISSYVSPHGVNLAAGGTVVNGSSVATGAKIFGTIGVYVGGGPATVDNFGFIYGFGAYGVQFKSAADRLIIEPSGRIQGKVAGGGGVLETVGAANTVSHLGATVTITNAAVTYATGFGVYQIDPASSWRMIGANALAGGQTLIDNGVLSLASGASLTVGDGATARVRGAIGNAGSIALVSAGAAAYLRILAAGATLSGAGTVALSGPKARILGVSTAATLINVDNTISGAGFIGLGRMTLVNKASGVIDATGALVVSTTGATLTNAGLMEATGAGGLVLSATTIDNHGGTILAATGAHVNLQSAVIRGGMVSSAGTGVINVTAAGGGLDGGTGAVTVSGVVQVRNGDDLLLTGAIANAGKLATAATTGHADLIVGTAGATLTGGGQVTLGPAAGNRLFGQTAGAVLTNVDNRIGGAGMLGNGALTLVNLAAGRIVGSLTTLLTIDTGAVSIVNAGVLGNTGKGGTLVKSAVVNTGTLLAATAGTLTLAGAVTGSGHAVINNGVLFAQGAFSENVTFSSPTGTLKLAHSQAYTGTVTGLSGTGQNAIDLVDIPYDGIKTTETYAPNAKNSGGVLTVTNGAAVAHIKLVGIYSTNSIILSADPTGGTRVIDPTAQPGAVHAFIAAAASLATRSALGGGRADPEPTHAHEWRPTLLAPVTRPL